MSRNPNVSRADIPNWRKKSFHLLPKHCLRSTETFEAALVGRLARGVNARIHKN